MTRKPWKRVTINVSENEYKLLRAAAGLEQLSLAAYVRYLLVLHVENFEALLEKKGKMNLI